MNKWVRLILLAVAGALIAALFDRRRRHESPPAQWPDWSARRPPSADAPPGDTGDTTTADEPATTAPPPDSAVQPTDETETTGDSGGTGAGCVEPVDGRCPETHPVRAKKSSRIYHLPGMLNYDRMRPDVCFVSTEAAEAAGYRRSKV
ncbi:MAG TPA: hypothetical protein ENI86_11970 [Acidimicrobiales bacterium]|nr:hypothetical protein [Acidimicrobiales bacterium]